MAISLSGRIRHNVLQFTGKVLLMIRNLGVAWRPAMIILACCGAMLGLSGGPAQARIFVGIGIPFYGPGSIRRLITIRRRCTTRLHRLLRAAARLHAATDGAYANRRPDLSCQRVCLPNGSSGGAWKRLLLPG